MKIAVVSHLFPTPQNTAKGNFVLHQARALSELGHNVQVVSPIPYVPKIVGKGLDREASENIPRTDSYGNITVHYPRYWSLPGSVTAPLAAYSVRRTVLNNRRLFESADIINAHVPIPDGFGSVPLAEQLQIPLVVTVHGSDVYTAGNRWLTDKLIQTVFDSAHKIILNSTRLYETATEKFQLGANCHVIHNGIPTERILDIEAEDLSHIFPDERQIVATVANIIPRKGHKTVLDALTRIPKSERPYYLIIGDGPYRDEIERYVRQNGLNEFVHLTGYLPDHDDVMRKLKYADMMVLVSSNEAFGIAYLEAMACGLPVIGCEGEGPADYITNRKTGFLIPPQSSQALIEVLRELREDPDLQQKVGNKAQQVALNRFSWERNAKSVESVFQNALKQFS